MMPIPEQQAYLALYRSTDVPATLRAWRSLEAGMDSPSAHAMIEDCFAPLIERLKSSDVINADAAARNREARARRLLGTRVHKSAPHQVPSAD
jgi:hypothetical protein